MDRDTAIRNTHPTVSRINAERDAWDKDGNEIVLDEEKIKAEMEKLQGIYNSTQYQRARKLEYPSLEECIHAILDDGLEELQAKRQAVKQKYKKG